MKLIYFFVALALSAVAFFVALKFTGQQSDDGEVRVVEVPKVIEKPVPTVDIYVAREPIPIGEVVSQTLLDRQPWPEHLVLPDFIRAGGEAPSIDGMVTRTPFQAREPIIASKLANPDDPSFLAANLPKGMRAVTISTDAILGVAGFVFPGDRVDVLINHDVGGSESTDPQRRDEAEKITEVLLSDIKVLAVNQKATSAGAEGPIVPASVTLEVTQSDAQRLRLAEKVATLSLSLRSLHDREEIDLARPTGIGDLSRITPPTYFPVLYRKNDIDDQALQPVEAPGAEAVGAEAAPATEDAVPDSGFSSTIAVVRGVDVEMIEVERP